MVRFNIEVSKPAENDLHDIVRYISSKLDSPITAIEMMDIIETSISSLSETPCRCPLIKDEWLADKGYRKLIVKNYIVFYTIDEKNKIINVERILYNRRNWRQIL